MSTDCFVKEWKWYSLMTDSGLEPRRQRPSLASAKNNAFDQGDREYGSCEHRRGGRNLHGSRDHLRQGPASDFRKTHVSQRLAGIYVVRTDLSIEHIPYSLQIPSARNLDHRIRRGQLRCSSSRCSRHTRDLSTRNLRRSPARPKHYEVPRVQCSRSVQSVLHAQARGTIRGACPFRRESGPKGVS